MPVNYRFAHLPLPLRFHGRARLRGGSKADPQTLANRKARAAHAAALGGAASGLSARWKTEAADREASQLPALPQGKPFLVKVDPSLELDVLRSMFDFEVVSEQEEGFVLVATEDLDLTEFARIVQEFSVKVHGSGRVASVHKLYDDPSQRERLDRVLSARLRQAWPTLTDDQVLVVDVGVACTGTVAIPPMPKRGKRDTDASWARREAAWSQTRAAAYDSWDQLLEQRQDELLSFLHAYQAETLALHHGESTAVLPDSFTARIRISGKGFRDLVLNYPYVFEVVEPDDVALPQLGRPGEAAPLRVASPTPPPADAPTVCVVDSGIQQGHALLAPSVDGESSRCFLPGRSEIEVGDYVPPGGHGTRVAGAVLYGESPPQEGSPPLPFWIQNARVLDERAQMPDALFPPLALRAVVERYHSGARRTRIFNHSINSSAPCRLRHMSAWAAEIDALCDRHDVVIVQSVGNLLERAPSPLIGIREHLLAGRDYPAYLYEGACRVANPAQSLQALTVGSVAYGGYEAGDWRSFSDQAGQPSAFTRSGLGVWGSIKPEVVEYGGDAVRMGEVAPEVRVGGVPASCPDLVRSTLFPPGPASARDDAGTSYAAPKVARIVAAVQRTLPAEPALLYRALVVQSARWPEWAERLLEQQRALGAGEAERRAWLQERVGELIRTIGFGVPDEARATANTPHRTTLITRGSTAICARECHVYLVPIPTALRRPGEDFDVRIDVTLSYVAQPRRTRRTVRRYLATWLDWRSSKLGESLESFRQRVLRDDEEDQGEPAAGALSGRPIPWTLGEKITEGLIRVARRSSGTVQKDWAIVKSSSLPEHFCIAVRGHQGWNPDPEATARYCLAVTLDVVGEEVAIYEPLRVAVEEVRARLEGIEEASIEIELGGEGEQVGSSSPTAVKMAGRRAP